MEVVIERGEAGREAGRISLYGLLGNRKVGLGIIRVEETGSCPGNARNHQCHKRSNRVSVDLGTSCYRNIN